MSSVKNSQTINPREWQRPIWITLIVCAAFWLFGLGVKYLCSEIAGWINSLFNNTPVEIVIDLGSSDINVTLEKPEQEIRISCSGFSRVTLMSEDPRSITISTGVLLNNELIHPAISLQRYFTPKPKSQNAAHTISVIHIGLCHSRGLI